MIKIYGEIVGAEKINDVPILDLSWPFWAMITILVISILCVTHKGIEKYIKTKSGNIFLLSIGILLVSSIYILISLGPVGFVIESKSLPTFFGTMGDFLSPFAMLVTIYIFVYEKHEGEKKESQEYYIKRVRKCFMGISERVVSLVELQRGYLNKSKFDRKDDAWEIERGAQTVINVRDVALNLPILERMHNELLDLKNYISSEEFIRTIERSMVHATYLEDELSLDIKEFQQKLYNIKFGVGEYESCLDIYGYNQSATKPQKEMVSKIYKLLDDVGNLLMKEYDKSKNSHD